MRIRFVAVGTLLLLAGCQATPMASTPRSISFQGYGVASIQDATLKAQVHCNQFGRDAEVISDGSMSQGISTFRCVDR